MMRGESATAASTILCSVLIFLFLIEVEARNRKRVCASWCGELKNISYPFRLKGDPAGCGDPDYELSCENNKTILDIFPGKYYVKNISYYDQIIRLVDVNFSNGSCNVPSGSLEPWDGNARDFRFKGIVHRYYNSSSRIRFVKCSKNISMAANYTTVPCLTRNGTHVYAVHDGQQSYYRLQPSCWIISVALVDYEEIEFPTTYGALMKLLQGGFDLGWSLECRDCSLSGKSCEVRSWDKPLKYMCSREYTEITATQIILIYVGMALGALVGLVLIIVIIVVVIRRYRKRPKASEESLQNQQSLTPTISNA